MAEEKKPVLASEYNLDAKWDACLDLGVRRFTYLSLIGGFAGLLLFRLESRSNPFQEREDGTSQMAFGLLERMLTGQMTLEDFLRAIERRPLDDYDDQGDSRDVREANGRPNGVRKPSKEEMAPSALEGVP
ncbi:uncharacterized protein LOC107867916 isoform X2 [Capsicum annuum]|uniref:uncharacterized protein LOC107867916 isoform X2 n=1 Tax=Capsicum annuum TaxID=4072 RepID=UPI001FB17618|nr:uncharacterized protein LOC107867916 isoform X2 [Capsicum annuum]